MLAHVSGGSESPSQMLRVIGWSWAMSFSTRSSVITGESPDSLGNGTWSVYVAG